MRVNHDSMHRESPERPRFSFLIGRPPVCERLRILDGGETAG